MYHIYREREHRPVGALAEHSLAEHCADDTGLTLRLSDEDEADADADANADADADADADAEK
ncbi:hypothetical protein [Enterovibrio norvegicus]|uniref:hypothetical protein n=1 Tax=Enterovibrio norvegicus TaxID=188144 RepID=UPI0012FFD925|nr:hypothetical protein [Enterovibrio norvegicus]